MFVNAVVRVYLHVFADALQGRWKVGNSDFRSAEKPKHFEFRGDKKSPTR